MTETASGEAGGGCPGTYASVSVNWGVLDIYFIGASIPAYDVQIAVIGDGGVTITTERKAGGGRPSSRKISSWTDIGVLSNVIICATVKAAG